MRRGVLFIVGLLCQVPAIVYGAPCESLSLPVGLPVAMADTLGFAFQCRSVAQTFVATDTALSVVTVWDLPRAETSYAPRILYIVGTSETGAPNGLQLLGGPWTLVVPDADPINPIPFRFELDPPFPLSAGGRYAIVLLAGDASAYLVAACRGDCYPDGQGCDLRPLFNCKPGNVRSCEPDHDLCFALQYCTNARTGSVRKAWGELKMLYR